MFSNDISHNSIGLIEQELCLFYYAGGFHILHGNFRILVFSLAHKFFGMSKVLNVS